MITFSFTNKAFKSFLKFEKLHQDLIKDKLKILKNPEYFIKNSKKLQNLPPSTHRIRAGRFRLLLKKISEKNFLVLKIAHRKDIYK